MSTTQRNTVCGEKTTNGKGVVYYKLAPGYPGDETKNCGLVGSEIDNNFFFLRGYDIESVRVDGMDIYGNDSHWARYVLKREGEE